MPGPQVGFPSPYARASPDPGRRDRGRDEGHPGLVVADVLSPALGREALAAQELDHLRLGEGREPELVAELAVIGQRGAGEAEDGAEREAALPAEGEKRL